MRSAGWINKPPLGRGHLEREFSKRVAIIKPPHSHRLGRVTHLCEYENLWMGVGGLLLRPLSASYYCVLMAPQGGPSGIIVSYQKSLNSHTEKVLKVRWVGFEVSG